MKKLINAIARLEYGVSVFCEKQSQLADEEGYAELSQLLLEHSQEEHRHGEMLNALVDGRDRIVRDRNLGKLRVIRQDGFSIHRKTEVWDTFEYHGQSYKNPDLEITITYEHFDGMSRRYWSLRQFFGGKKASEFDWADKLAFMAVLEEETRKFYQFLFKLFPDEPLGRIAAKLASDEQDHAAYLARAIREYYFADCPEIYIYKWRKRLPLAKVFLFFDVFRLFLT